MRRQLVSNWCFTPSPQAVGVKLVTMFSAALKCAYLWECFSICMHISVGMFVYAYISVRIFCCLCVHVCEDLSVCVFVCIFAVVLVSCMSTCL